MTYVIMRMVRTRLALSPLLVLAWAVSEPAHLPAQSQKYEGKDIVNIQFLPPAQPLDPAELFKILPLKRGQPLRIADVSASIDRLFATGRYSDIQVDAEPYSNGVLIRFLTKNSWFIGNVHAAGNISDPPNSGQLENAAELDLGQPYTDAKLQQGIANQPSGGMAASPWGAGAATDQGTWDNTGGAAASNQDYVDNSTWDQQPAQDSSWTDNSGGSWDSGSSDSGGGSSDDTF